ncbi:Translin-1 [Dispira parvispora]|uniref:Translin n=1 Tax=Dispira parvispora TaxID=1520584 RepID=A0A9W8E694_9FUNG|nr:Translin-1 [Dispira parvispora]
MESNTLTNLQNYITADTETRDKLREVVRELDVPCRGLTMPLNKIHVAKTDEDIQAVVKEAKESFGAIRPIIQRLAELVPPERYYRYNDIWGRTMQQAVFAAALITYLESHQMITPEQLKEYLGVAVKFDNDHVTEFHISVEEYLHGILSLPSELARFAVNSATHQAYHRPMQISEFVSRLFLSFQQLNLKNDSVRKRFDSLKYDVKKIEDVVFNVSVRGLCQ